MAGTSRTISLNVVGSTAGAQKSLSDLASHSEGIGSRIHGAFNAVLGTLNQSGVLGPFSQVLDQLGGTFDNLSGKAHSFGKTMMGIGAGAAGIGGVLTAIAGPEEQAAAQLKAAISAAGQSYDDFGHRIESTVKSQEKFGHTSTDTQSAIRILTQATGDTNVALKDMSVVANLAAAKHESLAEAATSLARVHGGATKVLKEFGVTAEKASDGTKALEAAQKQASATDATLAKAKEHLTMIEEQYAGKTKLTVAEQQNLQKAHEAVAAAAGKSDEAHRKLSEGVYETTTKTQAATDNIDKLGQKLSGQASAAAGTFEGHLKAIGAAVEDNAAKLGQKYGPALMGIGAVVTTTGGIIDIFSKGQKAAVLAEEAVAAATAEETVATDASATSWLAAGIAEMVALAPILLIIAGVAALGIGIYELVTNWSAVWGAIQSTVSGVWNWIAGHWPLLVDILFPPFAIGKLIFDHWNGILNFFAQIPGWIANAFLDVGKGIANGFIWGINAAIGAYNWLAKALSFNISIPSWVPGLGGDSFGISLPQFGTISYLAEGGIAMGPTLAMIGEAGPEAVVPLSQGGGMGFGGGGPIVLTVISEIDGRAVAKATHSYTRDEFLKLQRGTSAGRLSTVG